MISESISTAPDGARQMSFWWRLAENASRRWLWFVLPIVALTLVGFSQARNAPELYQSTATLSASSNPLVPEQQVGGAAPSFWETPAAATSRIINERLRTDTFLRTVAERAGLDDALEAGTIDVDVLRANVWAAAGGNTILSIHAQWDEPRIAQQLTAAVIDTYQDFLTDTVASDSLAAESFYSDQVDDLISDRDAAQEALREFAGLLPPTSDDGLSVVDQIEIDRLAEVVTAAEERIRSARESADAARLARTQLTTEVGQSFTVVDPATVPTTPESTLVDRAITVLTYAVLGFVIAAAALILTTVLDRSVNSTADLLAIDGINLVATAPAVKMLRERGPLRSRSRRRPHRAKAA